MASTASEWLQGEGRWQELEELLKGAVAPDVLKLWFELPDDIKQTIADRLYDTFSQGYWDDIVGTIKSDVGKFLVMGLQEGWSIPRIVRAVAVEFMGSTWGYAKRRATNIARTEMTHAMNGARVASNSYLKSRYPDLPMRQVWLSVLGPTTRPEHAALDSVPEDENGLWNLVGYKVPWPGHYGLPPEQRCNCQCTVVMEYGLKAAGLKYNPYHDPQTGRFTFAPGGLPAASKGTLAKLRKRIQTVKVGGERGKPSKRVADRVIDYMALHPDSVVKSIGGISIVDRQEWNNEYVRQGGRSYEEGWSVQAFIVFRTGHIFLKKGFKELCLHHEVGHLVARQSKAYKEWRARYNIDPSFDRHTEYSKTGGPEEAFCDSYAAYIAAKGQAKSDEYRATFKMVEEVIHGLRTH